MKLRRVLSTDEEKTICNIIVNFYCSPYSTKTGILLFLFIPNERTSAERKKERKNEGNKERMKIYSTQGCELYRVYH